MTDEETKIEEKEEDAVPEEKEEEVTE